MEIVKTRTSQLIGRHLKKIKTDTREAERRMREIVEMEAANDSKVNY
jgi:hypothetical protein